MSLSELILFPHLPQELYEVYKSQNNVVANNLASISREIEKLFRNGASGEKLSQCILFDLYISINHHTVYKDNITGKRIEQRLSKLFALSTGDEMSRNNPDIRTLLTAEEIELFDNEVLNLICSNYREKGDLFFINSRLNSLYKLSIKSLVPSNDEINFGAFEFQSTVKGIDGIGELMNLQERGRTINLQIGDITKPCGLGSSPQMKSIIEYVAFKGKFEEYINRFQILLKGVFKDDFLIYIKNNDCFTIYLIDNNTFINIILERVRLGFKQMRFEGNAIRATGLREFIRRANATYNFTVRHSIPNFDEIEHLLLHLDHSKLVALREFINS